LHYNVGDFDLLTYLNNSEFFTVREGAIELLTGSGLGISLNEEMTMKEAEDRKDFSWRNPTCEFSMACQNLIEAHSLGVHRDRSRWRYQGVVVGSIVGLVVCLPDRSRLKPAQRRRLEISSRQISFYQMMRNNPLRLSVAAWSELDPSVSVFRKMTG
jgi:hypothetical protein